MKEVELHTSFEDAQEKAFNDATLQLNLDSKNDNDCTLQPNGNVINSSSCYDFSKGQVAQVPWPGDKAEDFFSFREGLLIRAIEETKKELISDSEDGEFIGSWLLTEVSSWDNEMERIVILTTKCMISVKYDFIALKVLKHRKIPLDIIDTLVIGDLDYPPVSLIPHIDGIATGVSNLMKGCLVKVLEKKWPVEKGALPTDSGFSPRTRKIAGVRTMWNGGRPLPFVKKWNPFEKDIPFNTFTSHPLLWHADSSNSGRDMYNVEVFTDHLTKVLDEKIKKSQCFVESNPIILENYIGLGALIHNRNSLGFFKLRGKISF
ncbi:tumor protein p63-regulated gene 1-like protein [Cimex lectularius]|uniref:HSac2 domain-containing protein n=1 Tax=Cimex lectularius TaxID=79782 RepID=A0A8I6RV02_CIMLE|nr:tumor protein p63-regulated gene 1-like protein [Cimex lectularius]